MQINDASQSNQVIFGQYIHFYSKKYSRVYETLIMRVTNTMMRNSTVKK